MSHSKVYDELLPESDDTPATEPEKSKTPPEIRPLEINLDGEIWVERKLGDQHCYYNANTRGTQWSKPGGDGVKIITPAEVSKYHDHIEALRRELSMNCTFVEHSFEEVNRRERQIEELKERIVWLESKIVRLRGIVSKCIKCSKCNPPAAADKKTVAS